jgi:3-hydroxybutyryl-CoA dehydrogenase
MALEPSVKSKPGAKPGSSASNPKSTPAAVIGLGLMGTSIIACLLAAGHRVVGITRDLSRRRNTRRRILTFLQEMKREKLLSGNPDTVAKNLQLSEDYTTLSDCGIVVESVLENLEVKHEVLRKIEVAVSAEALIGSNTSALPITELQRGATHPERILGIHWGEPAHILRFLEVICGDQTSPEVRGARRQVSRAVEQGADPRQARHPWLHYQPAHVCHAARSLPLGRSGVRYSCRRGSFVPQ